MSERLKLFAKYLNSGGIYPCNIFNLLVFETPEQVLEAIQSVDPNVSLRDRVLCNCLAQTEIECDCSPMPLLNHLVYIISSFEKSFDLAKQLIEELIVKGCDLNKVDPDIGSVLHSVICCIDNDKQMNVSRSESEQSFRCLDYLLSLNSCDIEMDVGSDMSSKARGTPLSLAVEKQLVDVVKRLIVVGVSVKIPISRWLIPEVLNERFIEIFDLLFEAGLHFDSDLKTNNSYVLVRNSKQIKYKDWLKSKKSVPMNLKSLSRIVVRNTLNNNFNDKRLMNFITIPRSLKIYLNFEERLDI